LTTTLVTPSAFPVFSRFPDSPPETKRPFLFRVFAFRPGIHNRRAGGRVPFLFPFCVVRPSFSLGPSVTHPHSCPPLFFVPCLTRPHSFYAVRPHSLLFFPWSLSESQASFLLFFFSHWTCLRVRAPPPPRDPNFWFIGSTKNPPRPCAGPTFCFSVHTCHQVGFGNPHAQFLNFGFFPFFFFFPRLTGTFFSLFPPHIL